MTDDADHSNAVRLRDVRFAWRRDLPDVISIPELSIARGERVFLAGASGTGKSTLLALLGGVNLPREGVVQVVGHQLVRLNASQRDAFRADQVGFVFQMFNLVPYLSVIDNITLPCEFSQRRRQLATERGCSLHDEAVRLLDALELTSEDIQRRSAMELSIGQQQRVAAARALIGAPSLIIADEPTSALDEGTRERFLELLFNECSAIGTTLLFVSHDGRLGPLFDRQIAMDEINKPGHLPL